MPHAAVRDVFTAEEVARAAGVPLDVVQALINARELSLIPGTAFITTSEAVSAGRRLRTRVVPLSAALPAVPPPLFSGLATSTGLPDRRAGLHAFASSFLHAALLVAVLWFTSYSTETAPASSPAEQPRMVFLVTPGPGGGGGGGGMRNPLPARRIERRGQVRPRLSVPAVKPDPVLTSRRAAEPPRPTPDPPPVPKPVERAPEPLPSRVLVAPVVAAAVDNREREGVVEKGRANTESQGSGIGGGAGSGQGTGNGEGLGAGIGEGSGGGTGGGPFRPGSGIDAPHLLKEVKAEYTEEARRRGVTGDVVLEIVVRRDGSVGEVTVQRGLGSGLDQRAVSAVRQWRFSPARRKGEPVDVIVEVAVEFTLR